MEKVCAVGIDITEDYAQLSYVVNVGDEPVSLSVNPEEKKYLIPLVMYYREDNNSWYIGDEAIFNSSNDKKPCIELSGCFENDSEKTAVFLEKLIEKARDIVGFKDIDMVCITVENTTLENERLFFEAMERLGFGEEKVRIINHDEAFLYYTMNQKRDIWVNDVVLFDFTKGHFIYRRINEIKSKTPTILQVEKQDMSADIYMELLESDTGKHRADNRLLEFITREFKKHIICTTFLTGEGFYEDWAKDSLQELLGRRRVFKGYNLFVKGAAYAAEIRLESENAKPKHMLLCNGRTKADVGMFINNRGKETLVLLSSAGANWYEAGAEAECILDNISSVNLVLVSAINGESCNKEILLKDFPKRPNKTTRVKITLGYRDDDVFDIIVSDMGFGELFKSSGKFVKETISVKNELDL